MEIFQPVIDFFNFVGSLLTTITEGIFGISTIIYSIINLIYSITRILPSPMYPCFVGFMTLYYTIFVYKLFRKG